jgi:hypothetical protein
VFGGAIFIISSADCANNVDTQCVESARHRSDSAVHPNLSSCSRMPPSFILQMNLHADYRLLCYKRTTHWVISHLSHSGGGARDRRQRKAMSYFSLQEEEFVAPDDLDGFLTDVSETLATRTLILRSTARAKLDFDARLELGSIAHSSFAKVYTHYVEGGFSQIVVRSLLDTFQILFTAAIVTFLVCYVDYAQIGNVATLTDAISFQGCVRAVRRKRMRRVLRSTPAWFALIAFCVGCYFVWHSFVSARLLTTSVSMRSFYKRVLKLDDSDLLALEWGDVAAALSRVPRVTRVRASLDELDIANRIMRRDNYVIAMVNSTRSATDSECR